MASEQHQLAVGQSGFQGETVPDTEVQLLHAAPGPMPQFLDRTFEGRPSELAPPDQAIEQLEFQTRALAPLLDISERHLKRQQAAGTFPRSIQDMLAVHIQRAESSFGEPTREVANEPLSV
jgi:hypothetical protein